MATPAILKRIDNVETKLTPNEWAIRLADEMRKYPSEIEYYCSFQNYSSNKETPFGKPFFILNKQAEEQHPGHKSEDIRIQNRIARQLRGEYQILKLLIMQCNEKMKRNSEIWKLKASHQLSNIKTLLLQDVLVTRNIKIGGIDLAEYISGLGFPLMKKDWRLKTMELIMDFCIYDAVIKTIQEKYFDGHSIIYRDLEDKLAEIKTIIEEAGTTFNEYLKILMTKIKTDMGESNTGDTKEFSNRFILDMEETRKVLEKELIIGISEKWAKDAKDIAVFEILEEIGKYEEANAFVWNIVQEKSKEIQAAQNELDSIRTVSE